MSRFLLPSDDPARVTVNSSPQKTTRDASGITRGTITPLIDGQAALKEMQEAMSCAKSYIFISAWYLHVHTKLPYTKGTIRLDELLRTLSTRGIKIFVLITFIENKPITIGKFSYELFRLSNPASVIAAKLSRIHRNVFSLVDKHPYKKTFFGMTRIIGCHHEKFMAVDGQIAFCGGMEFTTDYSNSSPEHKVPLGLRHDIHMKCEGSIAAHLDTHFRVRWQETVNLLEKVGDKNKSIAITLPPIRESTDKKDHAVQIVRTRSGEEKADGYPNIFVQEIRDSYIAAINEATRLIYIEQQYFRDKELAEAMARRLRNRIYDKFEVIFLLPEQPEEPPSPVTDHVLYLQSQALEIVKNAAPQRVGLFSIRKEKSRPESSIYVHSKMMLIDDKWFTVGSANANPRGLYIDSEVNLLVRDDNLAKELRKTLWKEHLQISDLDLDENSLSKEGQTPLGLWKDIEKGMYKRKDNQERPKSRIIVHTPSKGKKINLSEFGIPWYIDLDIDFYI